MKKIAIIGAAGYVGRELVKSLDKNTFEIFGITHPNGIFLLESFGINLITSDQYISDKSFDIVVNFAYPNRGPALTHTKANEEIFKIIEDCTTPETKILHCSTQAVFGYGLEYPVYPRQIKNRADHTYISTKISLENQLIKNFPKNEVHIIRLGNIWGPGSPAWTLNLINRIEFSDVIGISGLDGYSNITDIGNIISYIHFLINYETRKECHFHHLAEFSHLRWSHWIKLLSNELGINPIYVEDYVLASEENLMSEVKQQLYRFSLISIAKGFMRGRFSGHYMRNLLSILPGQQLKKLEDRTMAPGFASNYFDLAINDNFLKILSCQKQFENEVLSEWQPPVDTDESWQRVKLWMKSIGFL